ncbi:serine-threonine/tyrosine-protein kinase catalytic domain-containing protein [Artemisia annua]|uniref:Serine-threonine/tyrosine-protein kinase catalytic domain-containing protein n=1 Tax=Artemisia annua TaxID=35608 RepID=A0A2U1NG08_ARTAN|nr:serine-threonine/tyrosine-protein kinase catalytic domain-containing protein [Artemisia annua]
MTKVSDNWERLVRGALRREHLLLTGKSHERKSTNINAILQAADEIQPEDAHVSRILCEQAYFMAQSLDPKCEGRGILQFRTAVASVIKQQLAKKDGRTIDRKCDVQHLWNFYQNYKRKHRVDEILKEEQKMLEPGTFSADMGLRSQETKKVFTTLKALVEVMEFLVKEAAPDGVGREIAEELKRLKLEYGNKTDGKEVKLEDVGKQGKEEGAGKQLSRKNICHKGSTSRPKEWQYLEISIEEIKQAAKNFQYCIGKGGYGLVYKGKLYKSGKPIPVAIKRLNEQFGQGLKEFLTEIQLLSGNKHPNLISLLGYCEEDKEKILVYEYAKRGSLDQYLRRDNTTNYTLTWHQRLKICAGAARGLAHLHNHVGKNIRIIHRDIKSANILLDKNWVAKISDFGLSKLSLAGLHRSAVISHPCGTMGYCEPEYMITGILTKESDVYSFGIVLFEVLCGRLCGIKDNDGILLSGPLVKEFYERKRLEEIIDPSLKEHFSSDSVNKFSEIAYRCLHYDRKQRPPMDLVVKELEDLLEMELPQVITVGLKVNMHCEVCAQKIRKRILRMKGKKESVILNVGGLIRASLKKLTGDKTYLLVVDRDGVSNIQFNEVLPNEVCISLEENYMPPVTVTRFFPLSH